MNPEAGDLRKWIERARKSAPSVTIAWITAVYLGLSARLLFHIHQHAANMLFLDQWDFYTPLFRGEDLWTLFRWQHGPHRMGIGLVLTKIVAELSRWDTRVESLVIGGVMVLNALLALVLKKRITGRWEWWDGVVPLLFLSMGQASIFLITPNLSYAAVPLLLLLLYGHCLTLRNPLQRYACILVINFLSIYTGFGIFLGLITPVIIGSACMKWNTRSRRVFYLLVGFLFLSLLSLASFFVGWRLNPAVGCFQFPHPRPHEYFLYMTGVWQI